VTRKKADIQYTKHANEAFFQVGIALYWAEGSKRNSTFQFVNSDEKIIITMLAWLEKYLTIQRKDITFRLYIHKPYAHERCEDWWQQKLGISGAQMRKTVYKPTDRLVKKRPQYKGCLRIEINRVALYRTVMFWLARFETHYK
jgi:hypothetical protein